MSDESVDIEQLKKDLRSLTISSPHPLSAKEILKDYTSFIGPPIPYEKFGYTSLEKFFSSIPDVLLPERQDGVLVYRAVSDSSTKHIADFVEKQRKKKKPKVKKARRTVAVPEPLRQEFRRLFSACPGGILAGRLPEMYARVTGKRFCPQKVGFHDSKSLLRAMPDIVRLEMLSNSPHGFIVYPVPTLQFKAPSTSRSRTERQWSSSGIHAAMRADQAQTKLPPGLKQEVYQVLAQRPQGIWAARLPIEFQNLHGHSLSSADFGYTSVVELLSVMPDVCKVERPQSNGDWMVYPAQFQNTAGPSQPTRQPDKTSQRMTSSLRDAPEGMNTGAHLNSTLRENVRVLLEEHKEGLPLRHFLNTYRYRFGSAIDLREVGRADVEALLLLDMSDIVDLKVLKDRGLVAYIQNAQTSQNAVAPSTAAASHVTHNTATNFATTEDRCHVIASNPRGTAAPSSEHGGRRYSIEERFATPPTFKTEIPPPGSSVSASVRLKPSERLGFKPAKHPAYDSHHEVLVVHVESPSDFYLQLHSQSTAMCLTHLNHKMGSLFERRDGDAFIIRSVNKGRLCAALYPNDHCWYRAVVLSSEAGKVEVIFVDYGNKSIVPISGLRSLRSEFLELPCQALHCRLAGIEPVDGVWPQAATERLIQLTGLGKPLMAYVSGAEEEVLLVTLTDTHGDEDLHINDVLVSERLAICTGAMSGDDALINLTGDDFADDLPPLEPLDISDEDDSVEASDAESLNDSSAKDEAEEVEEKLQMLSELLSKLQDHKRLLCGDASPSEVVSLETTISLTTQRYERLKSRQEELVRPTSSQSPQQQVAVPHTQANFSPATHYDHHPTPSLQQVNQNNQDFQAKKVFQAHYQPIRPVSVLQSPYGHRMPRTPGQFSAPRLAEQAFPAGVARGILRGSSHWQPPQSAKPPAQPYHNAAQYVRPSGQPLASSYTHHSTAPSNFRSQNPVRYRYPHQSEQQSTFGGGYNRGPAAARIYQEQNPSSSAFRPVLKKNTPFSL